MKRTDMRGGMEGCQGSRGVCCHSPNGPNEAAGTRGKERQGRVEDRQH